MYIKITDKQGITVKQVKLDKNEVYSCNPLVESGILLQSGELEVILNRVPYNLVRRSVFTELPSFVHVSVADKCIINSRMDSEFIIVEMINGKRFESKVYGSENFEAKHLGIDRLEGRDGRTIVDIVNCQIEPNANIVLGEIISDQGSWSSYPPHSHEQPEVYGYKFDRLNGFGISIVGDKASIVKEGDITEIPGELNHPQVCAPGYRMYYFWIIRNFEDNPWTDRIYQSEHQHLLEDE